MKAILSLIISGALVVSGFCQTRNVLVGTNNAVVQPTNFWSADASNARTGLGLGTAATNPASAFQPSSATLSNLAVGGGASLTNISASNIVGTLSIGQGGTGSTNAADARTALGLGTAATNPASAFQPASVNLTNLAANNGANLTNVPISGVIGALATNGNAAGLTNFPALLLRTNGNGSGLTNLTAANITGTVGLASNVTGTIAISNGGSGATTAGGARTNLGLGATNTVQFENIVLGSGDLLISNGAIYWNTNLIFEPETTTFETQVLFTEAAATRTNLGLGWSALTNTNASGFQAALFGTGTNPVLVNTNGEVVSPTNFWQEAPITTTFIESQPTTNSSTNISPSRLLHIHSLATNIVNTTNTIILPTNALTFEGDMAMVVHKGPTNSLTQVRQSGSTNNLITLNKFNEAVEFTYYNNNWQFLETVAFTAPIYFSGTNAAANAAASRTNLGLGNSSSPEFASLLLSDLSNTNAVDYAVFVDDTGSFYSTSVGAARTNLGLGATWLTNTSIANFQSAIELGQSNFVTFAGLSVADLSNTNAVENVVWAGDDGALLVRSSATTRTNLGLGATNNVTFAGLTNNGDITINQTATNNGLLYIYRTNAEPFLGLANLIASNNTTVSNESLFRVGVAEATNKAAQFGFRSTNTNGNGVAVFSVYGYNALMMVGPSDPAAGTNPIEATVYSISPTNKVMTLISTNTSAMQMHRSLGFDTNLSSVGNTNLVPATNNQISKWLRVYIGTNTFYLPLYQ